MYVSSSGQITLKKAGSATVTATLENGKSASCQVTVKAADIDVSDLTATIRTGGSKTIYIDLGATIKLDYDLSDPDVDKNSISVSWFCDSDNNCLSIDQNGNLTASAAGSGIVSLKVNGSICLILVLLLSA